MRTMWELIKVIEDAGIEIRSVKWEEEGHLNFDVDHLDCEAAAAAVNAYWNKKNKKSISSILD